MHGQVSTHQYHDSGFLWLLLLMRLWRRRCSYKSQFSFFRSKMWRMNCNYKSTVDPKMKNLLCENRRYDIQMLKIHCNASLHLPVPISPSDCGKFLFFHFLNNMISKKFGRLSPPHTHTHAHIHTHNWWLSVIVNYHW